MIDLPLRIARFYLDGFRSMDLGRTLWKWIALKAALLLILGWLVLPDRLQEDFADDRQRAAHVLDRLTPQADRR